MHFDKNLKWVAKLMHRQDNNTVLQFDIIKKGRDEKQEKGKLKNKNN